MAFTETSAPPTPPAPQNPPPVANFRPSETSTTAKTVVLSLLAGLLILMVLPIAALLLLGSRVEEPAVEQTLPREELVIPAGDTYVDPNGGFTIQTSPDWGDPTINPNTTTGLPATAFELPAFSSPEFTANINISSNTVTAGSSLQALTEEELRVARTQLDEIAPAQIEVRNIGGEQVSTMRGEFGIQGLELGFFSVGHLEGSNYRLVTMAVPLDRLDDALAAYEQHLLSLRSE